MPKYSNEFKLKVIKYYLEEHHTFDILGYILHSYILPPILAAFYKTCSSSESGIFPPVVSCTLVLHEL